MPAARPGLRHPLSGSNPATLLKVLAGNGPIPREQWPQLAAIASAVLLRWPFTLAERAAALGLARRAEAMPAPVFIIGHWRSGTTHLYNVLSKSRAFNYVSPLATGLPWEMLSLARALRPLLERALPAERFIDRIPVEPDSPQEDEIALANMTPLSFYHGIYFPQHFARNFNRGVFFDGCTNDEIEAWQRTFVYFLAKVWCQHPQQSLLIKNPVYSGRVALLQALWPQAQFIHIYRNPYRVFSSMQTFYRQLFRTFALQPVEDPDRDEWILQTYPRLMEACLQQTAALPAGQLAEVCFEQFEADPLGELERIYATLHWDGFDTDRDAFARYLDSVSQYQKNPHALDAQTARRVRDRWHPFIERWGYEAPVSLS